MTEFFQKEVEAHLRNGELVQAADAMLSATQKIDIAYLSRSYRTELLGHAAALASLDREERQGIKSSDDTRRERLRLGNALAQLLDEFVGGLDRIRSDAQAGPQTVNQFAATDSQLGCGTSVLTTLEDKKFKVALSFPGEMRHFVSQVAMELKKNLSPGALFYDQDFTAHLARPNLDTLLQTVYLKNTALIVVFLSAEYESKEWCGLEWRVIRELIKTKHDRSVMLMRFDKARISDLLSLDGYVDLVNLNPAETARLILERASSGHDIGKQLET